MRNIILILAVGLSVLAHADETLPVIECAKSYGEGFAMSYESLQIFNNGKDGFTVYAVKAIHTQSHETLLVIMNESGLVEQNPDDKRYFDLDLIHIGPRYLSFYGYSNYKDGTELLFNDDECVFRVAESPGRASQ
jgi:hypothetical protein